MENKKKLRLLGLSLLFAVGGSFYQAYNYEKEDALPLAGKISEEERLEQETSGDGGHDQSKFTLPDAGRPWTLNQVVDYSKRRAAGSSADLYPDSGSEEYAAPNHFGEYTVQENFSARGATFDELIDLFHQDCAGRCFYQENGDGTITKITVKGEEGIQWYDEVLGDEPGCYEFQGSNFWLYLDDSGSIKEWGVGRDSKIEASEVYRRCEQNNYSERHK